MSVNVRNKRKLTALQAILAGSSLDDAAQQAGVSPRTIRRWMHDDESFAQELRDSEKEIFAEATRLLLGRIRRNIDRITAILDDEKSPPGTVLRAAELMMEITTRLWTVHSLDERLIDLEEEVYGKQE
jgi:hypothetical protein